MEKSCTRKQKAIVNNKSISYSFYLNKSPIVLLHISVPLPLLSFHFLFLFFTFFYLLLFSLFYSEYGLFTWTACYFASSLLPFPFSATLYFSVVFLHVFFSWLCPWMIFPPPVQSVVHIFLPRDNASKCLSPSLHKLTHRSLVDDELGGC